MSSSSASQLDGKNYAIDTESISWSLYRRTDSRPPISDMKTSSLNASLISGLVGITLVVLALVILYFVLVRKRLWFSSTVASTQPADLENQNQHKEEFHSSEEYTKEAEDRTSGDETDSRFTSADSIYQVPRTDSLPSVFLDQSSLSESQISSMSTIDYIVQELVEAASLPILTEHTQDAKGGEQASGLQSTTLSEAEGQPTKCAKCMR